MLRLALASQYHWSQRADATPENVSVGHWQVARVFALLGQADNARRFGRRALQVLGGGEAPPFHAGYAHEALARAAHVAGDAAAREHHLTEARRLAQAVPDEESRGWLLADLDALDDAP